MLLFAFHRGTPPVKFSGWQHFAGGQCVVHQRNRFVQRHGKNERLVSTLTRRLQVVYQVCFSPSVEINQDGVAALITTLDRRISDLLDEIIHFCEFQQSASHWQRVLH